MVMSNNKITKLNQYFYMSPKEKFLNIKDTVLLIIVRNWVHLIIQVKRTYFIVMIIN